MRTFLSVLLFGMWASAATAQPASSTVCGDDGSVSFFYQNNEAHEVSVDVQFAGRKPMHKDANGNWTVTLQSPAPDMYPYSFIVDGVSIMDPMNPQYFPNEGFKNSLLDVHDPKTPLAHDVRDVPHGTVRYIHYYSQSLGATNQAVVYLPPGYDEQPGCRYPVFYLISGTTDTEEVYYKVGRANYILDNLLAEGAAEEMIIVMPYGNPAKLLPAPSADSGAPQLQFGRDVFSMDLINDLMPYIEQHFRTVNDRDHRAIGGFSRGGNQALSNGLRNLDKFSYLCSYSSFTTTDIPEVYDHADETNRLIHLFWLGVGTDDFLYGNARDYMEFLDRKGIRSVKEFTSDKFGHTWMNARYFLEKTMRLLFRPAESHAAMRAGRPAPAATGQEPQFTPGVMARLFPKPIISPEYVPNGFEFRFKAPQAREVSLMPEPFAAQNAIPMQKDSSGLWTLELKNPEPALFTYCFLVDGMQVADPQNMYISSNPGFKPSVAHHTTDSCHFASMGNVPHGQVCYDLSKNEAYYLPNNPLDKQHLPCVWLTPTQEGSLESWFKEGGADALADYLINGGEIAPCVMIVSEKAPEKTDAPILKLCADDYQTWSERRQALRKLLMDNFK